MKCAGIVLACGALITGLIAAWYWYQSSRVEIVPVWPKGPEGLFEPVETEDAQGGWIAGTLMAYSKSGELNSKAALWTAGSVLLAALSSILSAL
jgi:hypothetical protein